MLLCVLDKLRVDDTLVWGPIGLRPALYRRIPHFSKQSSKFSFGNTQQLPCCVLLNPIQVLKTPQFTMCWWPGIYPTSHHIRIWHKAEILGPIHIPWMGRFRHQVINLVLQASKAWGDSPDARVCWFQPSSTNARWHWSSL